MTRDLTPHHGLSIACVPPSNIDEVVMVLKKEIVKTQSSSSDASDRGPEYRQMLVGAIHTCAAKFPDVRGLRDGFPACCALAGARKVVACWV
jgi:hypothetical protein